MTLFLGVDGGKSSTTALVGDETGRVLGSGAAGPSNHATEEDGKAKLLKAVSESVGAACREAGADPKEARFDAACLGFSGGPEDKRALLAEVVHAGRLVVTTDAWIALSGASGGEPGIITIAGTGSIAFGRNRHGKRARAGGWGFLFGDEGSAFDVARQGLRAALRLEEGWGPPTRLRELYLAEAKAPSMNELLHRLYSPEFPRPRVAGMARLVEQAAQEGDEVARGLLVKAGSELALLVSAVRRQIFEPGAPGRVSFVGGVFRNPVVRDQYKLMVEQEPGNLFLAPLYPPAAGALLEAYRAAGLKVTLSGLPDVKR